jgi:hypothetical protein
LPRLRFTLADAEAEATRLATEFVTRLPHSASARHVRTVPDGTAPQSSSSKHPVAWCVMFVYHPLEVVMDGGELFVAVNLETKTAYIHE